MNDNRSWVFNVHYSMSTRFWLEQYDDELFYSLLLFALVSFGKNYLLIIIIIIILPSSISMSPICGPLASFYHLSSENSERFFVS